MNNIQYVMQAVWIGLLVASFFLNTSRGFKAIELLKECFILLNDEIQRNLQLAESLYSRNYSIILGVLQNSAKKMLAITYLVEMLLLCVTVKVNMPLLKH